MFRGLLILFVTLIAMIGAVVGVVGAGLHRIASDQKKAASAAWEKPPPPVELIPTTNPADEAIVASETEEPVIPVFESIGLWAKEATIHGNLQLIETKGRGGRGGRVDARVAEKWKAREAALSRSSIYHLSGFRDAADVAEWTIEVPKAGEYAIDANYACAPSQEARFMIKVAGQIISFKSESLRFETWFHRAPLGKVMLPAGKTTLTIQPSLNPPGVYPALNLRSIQLIPAS